MRIFAHEVVRYVATLYDLSVDDLKGPCRARRVARPRQIAMHCVRRLCPHMSYPAIGMLLDRDHTTVMHGERKIGELVELEEDIAIAVDAVMFRFHPPAPGPVLSEFAALCSAYQSAMRQAA